MNKKQVHAAIVRRLKERYGSYGEIAESLINDAILLCIGILEEDKQYIENGGLYYYNKAIDVLDDLRIERV